MFTAKATVRFDSGQEIRRKVNNTILEGAQKKANSMRCREHDQTATVSLANDSTFRVKCRRILMGVYSGHRN
jgi:hypothetical protein